MNTPGGWTVVAATVQGASHHRSGMVNQDAFRVLPNRETGRLVVMALSDGHGGAKYFRSDRGATFAVRTACRILHRCFGKFSNARHSARMLETGGGHLVVRQMVRQWREKVLADFSQDPFQDRELDRLASIESPAACDLVGRDPVMAYGATLLAVVAAEDYLAWWQLGDGDILLVSAQGRVTRPFPTDRRFFANETTSLVTPQAHQEFRFRLQRFSGALPPLVLLATDGYANSFRDEGGFHQAGPDFLHLFRTKGAGYVRDQLPRWLEESTELGSGDDITVGLLCRHETILQPVPRRKQS